MSIKLTIKLCWTGTICLIFLIIFILFIIFNITPTPYELIDITPRGEKKVVQQPSLNTYEDIWKSQIIAKAPVVQTAPVSTIDFYKQLIVKNVTIERIISKGYAVVKVNGVRIMLEEQTPRNLYERSRPWEINISGHKIIALEILPTKGIKFLYNDKEIWLEYQEESAMQTSTTEDTELYTRIVTPQEGRHIINNMDKYIEELSPEVVEDGILLRRIHDNSEAQQFGFQENDIVQSVNGSKVTSISMRSLRELVEKHRRDGVIQVEILRGNEKMTLTFPIRNK
ncbi:MAG TPA: PDZ domain-containing protein [Planctomycetota bacterium]|nr:PDZ domain-containing protein [Planctomycetota bacterium]